MKNGLHDSTEPDAFFPEQSGQALIARVASGDRSAFAEFYDLHGARVLGFLSRRLRNRADAEEVLQETFHQVWRTATQYSAGRSSPVVWVMLIARSRLLDFLRRHRRDDPPGMPIVPAGEYVDPWANLSRDETRKYIHAALAQLPAEQRSAISLAFFDGLTHRQVAERQDIPLGTAKTRILLGNSRAAAYFVNCRGHLHVNSDHHPLGDPAELAALYLAGAMDDAERGAFEAHIAAGCPACDQELSALDDLGAALAGGIEPVAPRDLTRITVMARATDALGELSPQQMQGVAELVAAVRKCRNEVLVAARDWEPAFVQGLSIYRLDLEPEHGRLRALVCAEPGVTVPAHSHDQAEQCIVLDGDLIIGDERLTAGRYRYWKPGEPQPVQSTETGCLLLVSSPVD